MTRILTLVAALFAAAFAMPASAQSLGLVKLPIVFVQAPVVQQVHAGQRIDGTGALSQQAQAPVMLPSAPLPTVDVARITVVHPRVDYSYSVAQPTLRAVQTQRRNYNRGVAQFGPFRVLDEYTVALVGETDEASPHAFRAMMRAYPSLQQLDMVECPGTYDDRANMELGRMIRAARLITHVPPIGSVRSGAVELFLAGVDRHIADGAEFAVHSWMDDDGREADDFAADAPENRQYIDYYREMGMSDRQARSFYDMTNSVPHNRARWLDARAMRNWVGQGVSAPAQARQQRTQRATPRIAYASVTHS